MSEFNDFLLKETIKDIKVKPVINENDGVAKITLKEDDDGFYDNDADYQISTEDKYEGDEHKIEFRGKTYGVLDPVYYISFDASGGWHGSYYPQTLESPEEFPEFELDNLEIMKTLVTGKHDPANNEEYEPIMLPVSKEQAEGILDEWLDDGGMDMIANDNYPTFDGDDRSDYIAFKRAMRKKFGPGTY